MPSPFRFSLKLPVGLFVALFSLDAHLAFGQGCVPDFTLQPVQANNRIEWSKFPEFSLPFAVIYGGPRFGDGQSQPLKHGFSHLSSFSGPEASSLPVKNRALLWYSVASIDGSNQPWSIQGLESPWGNDTARYRQHWSQFIDNLANTFDDSRGTGVPKADIICLDIERVQELDRDILALKRDNRIPANYRALPDDVFLSTYKKDIRWWYAESAKYLRNKGISSPTKITSYSDVPVRGTWLNVTSNSWKDWTTNRLRTHYLTQSADGRIGGEFYDRLDILTPSAYYYYPYDNPLGKDYLSYLLFQIEANVAWSDKPVVPFVWLRYHDSFTPGSPLIPKFMAEATAIFPFFSGAKGLWLWENPSFEQNQQQNYATYEHFIHGLYRLSRFSDMFRGEHELVIPQSARDHMERRNPIWRGVVKDGSILVAAQNTYAAENQQTELTVSYGDWQKNITLNGREVHLCKYELSKVLTALDSSIVSAYLYPNPANRTVFVNLTSENIDVPVSMELYDLKGVKLRTSEQLTLLGNQRYSFEIPVLASGSYMIKISSGSTSVTKHLMVVP